MSRVEHDRREDCEGETCGGPGGNRTPSLGVRSALLFPLSYGPEHSGCPTEIACRSRLLSLAVLARRQAQGKVRPEMGRYFILPNIVYRICVRAEDCKGVNLIQPNTPVVDTVPVRMCPPKQYTDGTLSRRSVLHLQATEMRH